MVHRLHLVCLTGFVAALIGQSTASAADPLPRDALWRVVHNLCLPAKNIAGLSFPCTAVNRGQGFAVVKDIGSTGYLLVPLRRVTGVEDPQLLKADAPNYWLLAWQTRRYVVRRVQRQLDRTDIAMAANAIAGRSQDQLHIHVDCLRPVVKTALLRRRAQIGRRWTQVDLNGEHYRARSLTEAALKEGNVFRLVAGSDTKQRVQMSQQAIALVGARLRRGKPGFYVLTAHTTPDYDGHIEGLLNHGCR